MFLFLCFCILPVLRPVQSRFVPNSDSQRYASDQAYHQIDRSALNNYQAPDNLQYYNARDQRTAQDAVGVVYGNGRPIGFLQPYGNVYQITGEETNNQPNKREFDDVLYPAAKADDNAESDINDQQGISKFNNEYPALLTNFKIDSRLKNRQLNREYEREKVAKRDVGITRENVDRLKDALQSYEETPEGKASVEEVLGEMGFIEVDEGGLQKRESGQEEDEDMEKGLNAISLVKETHDVEKRKSSSNNKKPVKQKEAEVENEKDSLVEGEEEEEQKTREKRHDSTTKNSELMKNLEKSGDLTVSGNKSPLASSGETPKNEKQTNENEIQSETEEERVAREIQAKIDAIKDQVKRQIAEAKENGERKKRETNTLLKEETLQIDPQFNVEEDKVRHIRRKRNSETANNTLIERKKRAVAIPLSPYREEDEEMDAEDSEFEDDGFYDRTAALNNPQDSASYRHPRVVDDLEWENSLLYDDLSDGLVRKKRHNAEDKRRMIEHLKVVKERSEMPRNYPKRDSDEGSNGDKLQQIAEMSDADLFGALPEGYEGELARYKRVKRGGPLERKQE